MSRTVKSYVAALGFSRWSILSSFMLESVFLALLGTGRLSPGLASAWHFNRDRNFATFSEIIFNFRITTEDPVSGHVVCGFSWASWEGPACPEGFPDQHPAGPCGTELNRNGSVYPGSSRVHTTH